MYQNASRQFMDWIKSAFQFPRSNMGSKDIHLPLALTLEEMYSGCTKTLSYVRPTWIRNRAFSIMDEVTVSVPRGIRKGALIRYSGLGEKRPNLPAGDLIFKVQEIPHERFKRQKDDLIYVYKVPLGRALTGFQFSLETLDHRKLNIKVEEIVSPSYVKVIAGEGMPIPEYSKSRLSNKKAGDLLIKFDIIFPKKLSNWQVNELKEVLGNPNYGKNGQKSTFQSNFVEYLSTPIEKAVQFTKDLWGNIRSKL